MMVGFVIAVVVFNPTSMDLTSPRWNRFVIVDVFEFECGCGSSRGRGCIFGSGLGRGCRDGRGLGCGRGCSRGSGRDRVVIVILVMVVFVVSGWNYSW